MITKFNIPPRLKPVLIPLIALVLGAGAAAGLPVGEACESIAAPAVVENVK